MAEGFFAGFAQRMAENLSNDAKRQREQDEQTKKFQLDRLIEISQRPDLRDEEKAPLLGQILELAGTAPGKGRKGGKPGFADKIQPILDVFGHLDRKQAPAQQQQQGIGEASELAEIMGVGMGGNTRPRTVEGVTPTLPTMPTRQSPFYTAEEQSKRRLAALEPELQLRQKYDRRNLEDANWKDAGEIIIKPDGTKVQTQVNMITGQKRFIDLPAGESMTEYKERTRAASRVRVASNADLAFRKINERAASLAAIANPRMPDIQRDPKTIQDYWAAAAQQLINEKEISLDAAKSAADRNRALAGSARANMPGAGEPTPSAQRKFSQYSQQIQEIERKIKAITAKGGMMAVIGQSLANGTVIKAPKTTGTDQEQDADLERFLSEREQLLKELSAKIEYLKGLRGGAAIKEGVPGRTGAANPKPTPKATPFVDKGGAQVAPLVKPGAGGGESTVPRRKPKEVGGIPEKPKAIRGDQDKSEQNKKAEGREITVGGKKYRVTEVTKDGKWKAVPIK